MAVASRDRIALIKDTLVAALSSLTCVSRIDSFGSFAAGTADQWSDLDLLVTCHDVEQTAWLGAAVIRATRQVAFYRMFTDVRQPSGRYWFRGESPFHRIDVSFLSTTAFADVMASTLRSESEDALASFVTFVVESVSQPSW